jgi:hypothetical protein
MDIGISIAAALYTVTVWAIGYYQGQKRGIDRMRR